MTGPIDDTTLISWLKRNYKTVEFIKFKPPYQRKERSKILGDNIERLKSDKPLHEQKDVLIELWKDLVASAIIYLKSKDAREFFHDDGDYGIDTLGKFFENYCDFERHLYGSGEYYRDHVSHVFRVFILGEKLVHEGLKVGNSNGFELVDLSDSKLGDKKITADEKEAMWCIAALTHDLGYPTEVVNDINESLTKMLVWFNVQGISYVMSQQNQLFNDFILKLISSDLQNADNNGESGEYTTHVQAKYYFKYSRALEEWDHGVESCVVLVKSLVYFLETDYSLDKRKPMKVEDARQFLIRQRILRAIASHNCDYIYYLKLDLSFLLKIVDEMQEWGRPKLLDLFRKPPKVSYSIDEFSINSEEKTLVEYTVTFSRPDDFASDDSGELHENIKGYFKRAINKYIKVLRSAVDGNERLDEKLVLTLNVSDEIGDVHIKYKFIHKTPQDIKITFVKGEEQEYPILLERLENEKWNEIVDNPLKKKRRKSNSSR